MAGSPDPAHASGIVTVDAEAPEALHAQLHTRGVHVSLRNRKLRFAPHAYNTADDVDRLIEVLGDG